MNLIDFCKFPPKEITSDNIFNYTNLDFSSELWPFTGACSSHFYGNSTIIKHICDNIIDIHAAPINSGFCLVTKITYFMANGKTSLKYTIDSGYYLYKHTRSSFIDVRLLKKYKKTYGDHQKYIKELVIDNPNYYPKNIIKYNYMLILLLWTLKYQKKVANVLFRHKIIPFVYT